MMKVVADFANPGNVLRQLEADAWKRIVLATEAFLAELKLVLNVRNPPPFVNSSKPGEPPRKRTGFGQANVVREYDRAQLRSRVGVRTNAFYMVILEVKRNRPWFMVTLNRMLPKLRSIIGSGGTGITPGGS